MDTPPILEIERPRSAPELIGATFALYRRFPWLFPTLAFAVVVPYELIVLLATGTGPLGGRNLSFPTTMVLLAIEYFLITPLVSALHVHAVDDVRDGRTPTLGSVARRGLITLPVVVAAAIISSLGIAAGFLALFVPGVVFTLRWFVVAQAAALEDGSWTDALHRSHKLTDDHYGHLFGLWLLLGIIGGAPFYILGIAFGHSTTTPASFVVGVAVAVLLRSYAALATALAYFDLKARLRVAHKAGPVRYEPRSGRTVPPTGHPLDPDSWSDEERPAGWYIDPGAPEKMYYWVADGGKTWSKRSAKTPKDTLATWREVRGSRLREAGDEEPG
jgi:hypothetical protein